MKNETKRYQKAKIDSLIIVMIPLIPRYDASATHQGAVAGPEGAMIEEDIDLVQMAKKDLELLKSKHKKKDFKGTFVNSIVYPHVIYAGSLEGENSLSAAMKLMATNYKCLPEQIRNLAINITAHGNPETIGTKKSISFSPDDETTGLANLIYGYLEQNIALKTTQLSFYLLSCNSGYASYSEAEGGGVNDEDRVKRKILSSSFAGRFFQGVKREISEQDGNEKVKVSGYRGFIAHDQGKLVANRKEQQVVRKGESADIDHVRFIISSAESDSARDDEVILPKGYKFQVDNVTKSLTAQEAIDIKVKPELKPQPQLKQEVVSGLEMALQVAGEERQRIQNRRQRIEEQIRIEQAPRREASAQIFQQFGKDYEREIEFLVANKPWFDFTSSSSADVQKEVLDFLKPIKLWHFDFDSGLDMDKAPTETLLNKILTCGVSLKELSNIFTKMTMKLIHGEEISFNRLLEIYLSDPKLFEVLAQDGIHGLFAGNTYTLEDVIQFYQEQKKSDPDLDPRKIIDLASDYENGQAEEPPFPIPYKEPSDAKAADSGSAAAAGMPSLVLPFDELGDDSDSSDLDSSDIESDKEEEKVPSPSLSPRASSAIKPQPSLAAAATN